MANQTGRPIAPARKLVAAVMGTIAVFVMALGLGMSTWGVVIFGLALLALSAALGMVNMVRRGARAWVAGTAEVKAISPPPGTTAVYGRAQLQAVVVAPGLPTSEVMIHEPRVPVVKWPEPGDTLPIMVDVDDMRRVRINWEEAQPRERGEDPPPPPPAAYGADPGAADDLDADLLGDIEPPPWTSRDAEWGRGPDEPPPPPPAAYDAAGPILEGELVDPDDELPPLPRRTGPTTPVEPLADPLPADAGEPGPGPDPGHGPGQGPGSGPGKPGVTQPAAEPASAEAAPAGAAAGAPVSEPAGARPARGRPSPRPRPRDNGGGTATATAEPRTTTYATPEAPHQRGPHPDDALPVDVPLGESGPRSETVTATGTGPIAEAAPADDAARPSSAAPGEPAGERGPRRTAPAQAEPQWQAEPTPVAAFPTAPAPSTPPSTAPPPMTPPPSTPPLSTPVPVFPDHDDIDLPLDADPDPAPETTTAASAAVAHDLVAPLDDSATSAERSTATPPQEVHASTRFVSNAAHEAEVPTEQIATAPSETAPPPAAVPAGTSTAAVPAGTSAAAVPAGTSAAAVPVVAAAAVPVVAAAAVPAAMANGSSARRTKSDRGPWADLSRSSEPDDRTGDVITAYPSARPGPSCAIYGIGITVLVTDLARSVAFYRDTLGFYEIDNGDGNAVLATGDTRLVLRTDPGLATEAGREISLNLEVGDVEAVFEELRAKGVPFVHDPQPVSRGDRLELWSASFLDPDDHTIAVTQWRAIH